MVERDQSEALGEDCKEILRTDIQGMEEGAWIGFIWHKMENGGEL
jgi:hypothetical protein